LAPGTTPHAKREMIVSDWRVASASDGRGLLVYFDPFLEDVSIRLLTAPERADRLTRPLACAPCEVDEYPLDLDYDPTHTELNDGTS